MLFAHADAAVAREVEGKIDATLASLGLETKKEKNLDFYFNGAGKGSPAWPAARGTAAVPFLGCVVGFKGTIALAAVKIRRLLCDLRSRAIRTLRALRQSGNEQPGVLVCAALNQALDPGSPLQHRSADFFAARRPTDSNCDSLIMTSPGWSRKLSPVRQGPGPFVDCPIGKCAPTGNSCRCARPATVRNSQRLTSASVESRLPSPPVLRGRGAGVRGRDGQTMVLVVWA